MWDLTKTTNNGSSPTLVKSTISSQEFQETGTSIWEADSRSKRLSWLKWSTTLKHRSMSATQMVTSKPWISKSVSTTRSLCSSLRRKRKKKMTVILILASLSGVRKLRRSHCTLRSCLTTVNSLTLFSVIRPSLHSSEMRKSSFQTSKQDQSLTMTTSQRAMLRLNRTCTKLRAQILVSRIRSPRESLQSSSSSTLASSKFRNREMNKFFKSWMARSLRTTSTLELLCTSNVAPMTSY